MFRDAQTALWEAAALTIDAVSTNAYDCGAPFTVGGTQPDPSIGEPMCVILTVGVAAKVSGTTETYEFDIIQASASDLTTNQDILARYPFTNAQAAVSLKAGKIIVLPIPPGAVTRRYLGVLFDGANTPTITVTAWIAPMSMVQQLKDYSIASVIQ